MRHHSLFAWMQIYPRRVAWAAAQAIYMAAQVIAAGDFKAAWNTTASGIVVLTVILDATGALVGVDVLRDLPPLTKRRQAERLCSANDGSI